MFAPYSILAVDAECDLGAPVPFDPSCGGVLAVVRRDAVPIGSLLITGPPPHTLGELLALAEMRPDPPPEAAAVPLRLTVAVCTKDRPDLLARCLESVLAALEVAGPEVIGDLVVVDNASSDHRTHDVAVAAGATCVREQVPGLDVARNAAVAAASGDVLAFVDDDVVVDPSWARVLARAFASCPAAAAVAGQVRALRLDTPAQLEFERSGGFSLGWQPITFDVGSTPGVPFDRSMGVGCNMAFRRDFLQRVGPFDEALDTGRPMPGAGDLDMLVRAVLDGPVVYEPSALVFHDHRTDFEALRYQFYTWGKGYAVLLAKWGRHADASKAELRHAGRRRMRGYAKHVVKGPHATGGHRRVDAALMIVGFIAGSAGAYGRSQRRMAARRAAVAGAMADA